MRYACWFTSNQNGGHGAGTAKQYTGKILPTIDPEKYRVKNYLAGQ